MDDQRVAIDHGDVVSHRPSGDGDTSLTGQTQRGQSGGHNTAPVVEDHQPSVGGPRRGKPSRLQVNDPTRRLCVCGVGVDSGHGTVLVGSERVGSVTFNARLPIRRVRFIAVHLVDQQRSRIERW